jgi:hypothetical protein
MSRIIQFLLIFVCSITASLSDANTVTTWTDKTFVERAFKQVSLQSEYRKGRFPLSKWQSPIRYWFNHDVGNENDHEALAELHFEQLSDLTNLSITQASSEEQANFTIYFTRQSRWKALVTEILGAESAKNTRGSLCMFGNALNTNDASIARAVVIIPVDLAREHGKLISCIIEETTQALGLRNDSELSYPSVFNDRTPEQFLSPLDVILVQLMYEPALQSGMDEAELTPVLQTLIREYQDLGILRNATKQANLAPLVRQFK